MLKKQRILLDTLVVQNQENIVSDMDGEKVMMSIEKGKYYNLGVIGGVIWDGIRTPISANELIATLMTEYAVEYNECQEQVLSFMERLYKEGLIKVGEEDNKQ